jgi:hypothetical protein
MDKKIKIEKLDEEPPKVEKPVKKIKSILKKTSKLNLKGVRDPAKSRRQTLKLLTLKGHRRHDKTLKHKIGGLSDDQVKKLNTNAGLVKNPEVPAKLQREILTHAVSAGFLSL